MFSKSQIERDRELWNPAIHWFLNCSESELGESGTLGSVINSLEHGGYRTGVPSTDLDDYSVGWRGESPASKWRRLSPIWRALDATHQSVLMAHYRLSRGMHDGLTETALAAIEGALGKLLNASLWVHEGESLTRLIAACVDRETPGRDDVIRSAVTRTEKRVREAHRAWELVELTRREWILGPWSGRPMQREVACPQCGHTRIQGVRSWSKSEPLPSECWGCFAELKEPRRESKEETRRLKAEAFLDSEGLGEE